MDKQIVFFDGVCNFCNASVNFIIKRDPKANFTFCPLQSEEAKEILAPHGVDPYALEAIILRRGDKLFFKSRAALEIARGLNGLWPLLYVFVIVPPIIRDFLYSVIARNRYKWFGKSDSCMVPTEDILNRFVL